MNGTKRSLFAMFAAIMLGQISIARAQSPGAGVPDASNSLAFDWQNAHVFVGVRLWFTQWDVPYVSVVPALNPLNPQLQALQTVTTTSISNTKLIPMPTVGVSAGKWLISATYAPSTSYDCRCVLGNVDRREFDVNLGYEVVPRLYVSVGYKEGRQSQLAPGAASEVKIKGLLLGATASAPLTDTLALYGNAAYGFARFRSDLPDPDGRSHLDGGYQIGEVGLSWRVGQLLGSPLQNTSIALGYRFQSFLVNDTPSVVFAPSSPDTALAVQRRDVRSNTSGPVVTLIAFF